MTVFVTAFDQYALRAFEAQALDYLLKPFTEARFKSAFDRARAAAGQAEPPDRRALLALLELVREEQRELRGLVESAGEWLERVLVREEGRVRVIPVEEIDYIEAARNNVRLHAGKATHLLREPLGSLESRLDPSRFGRIHRSTVVRLDRVAEIEPWFSGDCVVVLKGGARLRLSRSHRQEFEARLGAASSRRAERRSTLAL